MRVICHESVIYVTGHVAKVSHNGFVIILCPSKQSSPKVRLRQHQ